MRSTWLVAATLVLGAPAWPETTQKVTAGPQFAAGGFYRFWFGDGYRDLWTTPIEAPVLDLATTAGGLTPVRTVGQAQTLGLALKGADGRAYTFRSLHKHPERLLPEALRDAWPARLLQDRTSATHPAAAVIVASLAEAAGLPHTAPRLVVIPDDPALGQFRPAFAHQFGTFDEYPLPAGDGSPGFMGATEIISTAKLWERWLEGPGNHVDGRALLRARALELWLDNYDRHRGQWRWMRLPDRELWQPLAEDPDMALVRHDGWLMARARAHAPTQLEFSASYSKGLEGPLRNSFEIDRWLLAGLDLAAWQEAGRELQARLTDEVIDAALRQMPPEWQAAGMEATAAALKRRRAGLVDYLTRVYRYEARQVDVQATDRSEVVSVARGEDGSLEVAIGLADGSAPWYRRRFLPDETREVRLHLQGGDDRVVRTGGAGGPIRVRVVAGQGQTRVDDSAGGGTDVWKGPGPLEVQPGSGTKVRSEAWVNPAPVEGAPWLEPRSFGAWTGGEAVVAYSADVDFLLGYSLTRTAWGFRTDPAASVQTLRGALATGDMSGKLEYVADFRYPARRLGLQLQLFGSGIERVNFFGFGNETPEETDRLRYRTRENVFFATPALTYALGRRLSARVGPELRYSESATGSGTILGELTPVGSGRHGQLALRGSLAFDSRERPEQHASSALAAGQIAASDEKPVTGLRLLASGFFVPAAWDAAASYGGADGMLAAYLGSPRAHLAARVGGRRLWGDYAWFDAAAIGGQNDRGYRSHRFSGGSSLYGTVSARAWLGRIWFPVIPMRLGVVGLADVGRVWVEGESSDTWHASAGGGLLLQPLGGPVVLHALAARGDEGTRYYLGLGYPF